VPRRALDGREEHESRLAALAHPSEMLILPKCPQLKAYINRFEVRGHRLPRHNYHINRARSPSLQLRFAYVSF